MIGNAIAIHGLLLAGHWGDKRRWYTIKIMVMNRKVELSHHRTRTLDEFDMGELAHHARKQAIVFPR